MESRTITASVELPRKSSRGGSTYGTQHRQGAVQGHGRAGRVEDRSELRPANPRRGPHPFRGQGARRMRGVAKRNDRDQEARSRAQRRTLRRRARALGTPLAAALTLFLLRKGAHPWFK